MQDSVFQADENNVSRAHHRFRTAKAYLGVHQNGFFRLAARHSNAVTPEQAESVRPKPWGRPRNLTGVL